MGAYEMDRQLVEEIAKIRALTPTRGYGKSRMIRKLVKESSSKCEKMREELARIRPADPPNFVRLEEIVNVEVSKAMYAMRRAAPR